MDKLPPKSITPDQLRLDVGSCCYLRLETIIGLISGAHMVGSAIGAFAGGLTYQMTGRYQNIIAIQAGAELVAAVLAFMIRKPKILVMAGIYEPA